MKLFRRSDLNAFWALFSDNLANLVILSGVCKFVFKMPDRIVFGRILPGIGIALILGLLYYAFIAYRLAKKEKRQTVTALPYGISTPVMFVYLFGIIGPVYWKTGSAEIAWQVGIAAAFIGGVIEAFGSIMGPWLKKITPRAGMLGTLAGIAIVWISTVPMAMIFEAPLIGFVSLIILFSGLIAGIRLPFKLPAGLLAIIFGTIVGFLTGHSHLSFQGTGLYIPVPVIRDMIAGIKVIFQNSAILAVVIPIEIYNFIETMNNVESAEAAGDKYNVRHCQIMDGIGTMTGAIFGSAFPTTVYIGHPAYKRLGAGIGYAWLVGLVFFVGGIFGLVAFLHHLIPHAAVAPMLVFIGVIIISQAFRATKQKYAIAVGIAIIPHISDIIVKKITGSVQQISIFLKGYSNNIKGVDELMANLNKFSEGIFDNRVIGLLKNGQGIHFMGQSMLSQGAIITGLLWGSITAFLIDFNFKKASFFSMAGAVLTLFGFIHAPRLGIHVSEVFWGYVIMSGSFLLAELFKLKKDPAIGHFDYMEK
ncbi:MAG: xanthine/uracil/vitamin C permease [Spirochaetes bacterium]|nr:xanthine/uracil/vitamin C permease [Spirochaetota bacterium]